MYMTMINPPNAPKWWISCWSDTILYRSGSHYPSNTLRENSATHFAREMSSGLPRKYSICIELNLFGEQHIGPTCRTNELKDESGTPAQTDLILAFVFVSMKHSKYTPTYSSEQENVSNNKHYITELGRTLRLFSRHPQSFRHQMPRYSPSTCRRTNIRQSLPGRIFRTATYDKITAE